MNEQAGASEKYSERHRVRVRVDHDLCVGFGDCVEAAPSVFVLDDDSLAIVLDPDTVERATLEAAAEACPVSAVLMYGGDGAIVVPREPNA